MNYITLGPTPTNEPCQQVGTSTYNGKIAIRECLVYARQLIRQHEGTIPDGVRFLVKNFEHDFGSYLEVIIKYDDNEEELDFALKVESELPESWDQEALIELGH